MRRLWRSTIVFLAIAATAALVAACETPGPAGTPTPTPALRAEPKIPVTPTPTPTPTLVPPTPAPVVAVPPTPTIAPPRATAPASPPVPTGSNTLTVPLSRKGEHNVIDLRGNDWEQYETDENLPGLYLRIDLDHLGDFLELHPDGTFYSEERGQGFSGNWESKGNDIILTWRK